jgi:3-methylfumaryl-CoA hydratase
MNTHRIHYDRAYAMNEEGYQGLVVQAPLTVTLLMDLLTRELPDARAKQINFRATRPLFDGETIRLEGKTEGDSVLLWAVDSEGALAMKVNVGLK